jgi:hypothetical protein
MKLPNSAAAFIDPDKLRDYSLNPHHPRGKHKARLFTAILGLTQDDTALLLSTIQDAIHHYDAVPGLLNEYGQRYIVDFPIARNQNTAQVRTVWIIRVGEDFPRLVSCYILR